MQLPPERDDHGWDCFAAWPSPPEGSSVMSEEPKLKSVPMVMSPLGQYFVGRLLMLRERLSMNSGAASNGAPMSYATAFSRGCRSIIWGRRSGTTAVRE